MRHSNNVHRYDAVFEKVILFSDSRGWIQTPADLAKSIAIEAAELLEHFQWDETWRSHLPEKNRDQIAAEIADIMWYVLTFCFRANIDLLEAVEKKHHINDLKYPVHLFQGPEKAATYQKLKRNQRNRERYTKTPEVTHVLKSQRRSSLNGSKG